MVSLETCVHFTMALDLWSQNRVSLASVFALSTAKAIQTATIHHTPENAIAAAKDTPWCSNDHLAFSDSYTLRLFILLLLLLKMMRCLGLLFLSSAMSAAAFAPPSARISSWGSKIALRSTSAISGDEIISRLEKQMEKLREKDSQSKPLGKEVSIFVLYWLYEIVLSATLNDTK